MMKKLISIVLLFMLLLVGIGFSDSNEVKAITINFDFGNVSPRFQYLRDDEDVLIPFEFTIYEKYDHPREAETFEVRLQQVTYNGNYIKTLEYFEILPYIHHEDTYLRYQDREVLASESTNEYEYIYVGDINTQYTTLGTPNSWEQLRIAYITVNTILITSSDYEFSEDDNYVILNPAVTNSGDAILIHYYYQFSDDYEADLYYDWSGINWDYDDVIFYQVIYNNMILFTGGVMKTPEIVLEYDTYKVEYGEFLIQDDGLVDFNDQSDFTSYLYEDDYWILHYRIPQGYYYLAEYYEIYITDIISNTLEESFTMEDIIFIQGGYETNFVNSFMIIPLDGNIGEGLITDYNNINLLWDLIYYEYNKGSYFIAMIDLADSNNLLDDASVVWNIVDEDDPFNISVYNENVYLEGTQRITFQREDEIFSSSYTTTLAKDYGINVDYSSYINLSNYVWSTSYNILDTLEEEDCVNVGWDLEPIFVPYSLDPQDYTIELRDSYCVIGEKDIAGHINSSLIESSLDDELGGIVFGLLVMLVVNIILILFTRNTFIYSFVNLTIILVLAFMGLMPMWLIIAITILAILGFKFVLSGGSNYE